METIDTYTTPVDAGANPLRVVSTYLAEAQRLLLVHKRDVLSRPMQQTLQRLAEACSHMVASVEQLDAGKKGRTTHEYGS